MMSLMGSFGRFRKVASTLLLRKEKLSTNKNLTRNAGTFLYRGHLSKEPTAVHYMGATMSFFLWYWILYHCWYEFDHLVPSHKYPDPRLYTDEELGIPPDEED